MVLPTDRPVVKFTCVTATISLLLASIYQQWSSDWPAFREQYTPSSLRCGFLTFGQADSGLPVFSSRCRFWMTVFCIVTMREVRRITSMPVQHFSQHLFMIRLVRWCKQFWSFFATVLVLLEKDGETCWGAIAGKRIRYYESGCASPKDRWHRKAQEERCTPAQRGLFYRWVLQSALKPFKSQLWVRWN